MSWNTPRPVAPPAVPALPVAVGVSRLNTVPPPDLTGAVLPNFSPHWDTRGGIIVSKQTRLQIYLSVPATHTYRKIYVHSSINCDVTTSTVVVDLVFKANNREVGRMPTDLSLGNGFGAQVMNLPASRAKVGVIEYSYVDSNGGLTVPNGRVLTPEMMAVTGPNATVQIPGVNGGAPFILESTTVIVPPVYLRGTFDQIELDMQTVGKVNYIYGFIQISCFSDYYDSRPTSRFNHRAANRN